MNSIKAIPGNGHKVLAVAMLLAMPAMVGALTTTVYEGEAYTDKSSDVVVATDNYPYIGTGYLDLAGQGSYVEWNNINCETAGIKTLIFKYANGSGANRPCELQVNGVVIKTMLFPPKYDDWTYYWNGRVAVPMNAGNNTVRLTVNSSEGGPNIDNIAVSSDGNTTPPGTQYNVRDYGAKGDGATNDTRAIQAAIDACSDGGSVVLSGGTFMSGQIRLKSNMTFWIDQNATLKGIQDNALYPAITQHPSNANIWLEGVQGGGGHELKEAFVYAEGTTNLTIAGGGYIDGNGDCEIWKQGLDETVRPMAVYIAYSKNVVLKNVDIINSAMWSCVPLENDSMVVDGINIRATHYALNKDGIDICDCHDMTISNVTIVSQDDAICPKSGSTKGVDNLMVKNVTINSSSGWGNYLKIGTMSYGSFSNITQEDIAINGTGIAGIAIESVDGADISNLKYSRIKMKQCSCPIFIIHGAGIRDHKPIGAASKTGSINGITFSDIECRATTNNFGCPISGTIRDGITYKVKNVSFTNVKLTVKGDVTSVPADPAEYNGQYPEPGMWKQKMPAWGYYIRHGENITFSNCSQTLSSSDVREAIVRDDITASMPEPVRRSKAMEIFQTNRHVAITLADSRPYRVGIYTLNGRSVHALKGSGESIVRFDRTLLRPGIYILTVHQSGTSLSRSMVIQ